MSPAPAIEYHRGERNLIFLAGHVPCHMTPQDFIRKWQAVKLSERSACQQHFLDLCELLGQPKPAAADPEGAWYTFERGVRKTDGEQGWADVWMRNHFGWEYKGKHKDLVAAYKQLLQYREDLENPPLLVVCDMDRFEVHTNFTGTVKKVYAFDLAGLADPANLDILRNLFTDAEALRPGQTAEAVTQQAAEIIGQVADGMRVRGVDAHRAAHFLMKLMFSMFAEDIDLLKNKVFSQVLQAAARPGATNAASQLSLKLGNLFKAMADGGSFGADDILHFNGGLFADADVIDLKVDEIQKLAFVATLDWSNVEPSVFGTLFERILDPAKRSQIGAHYTSRDDILLLLEPVVMQPLRREWAEVQAKCEKLVPKIQAESKKKAAEQKRAGVSKKGSASVRQLAKLIDEFHERLTSVTVLDPACGSGNFLYVSLNLLMDLEKEVITYASRYLPGMFPEVRPTQVAGIEINPYAHELASVVIWIGYLQWMHHNGFNPPSNPVLEPIESIRNMDAILDLSQSTGPVEPEWPKAEFIVGNPPFLGGNKIRAELTDEYVDRLFELYQGRVPAFADLCCYWFEKTRELLEEGKAKRAGLLATQGIRGGANREVLTRIKESGDIFFAESDRVWVLDGANVHVSMVGFDAGSESTRILDGRPVAVIHAHLGSGSDIQLARSLASNSNRCFMGASKKAPFDILPEVAVPILLAPNASLVPNSDVLRPWSNGKDITQRARGMWIIDFGNDMKNDAASAYEGAFEYAKKVVLDSRANRREARLTTYWWRFGRPRVDMRIAIRNMPRYIVTPAVAKHRLFTWLDSVFVPDQQLLVFASTTDDVFGILHSRAHEQWTRVQGTQVRERESGFRYTPTSCFDTFPFPRPTESQRDAIAEAARELDRLRTNWLNPPEWTTTEVLEFPGTVGGPWDRYIDPATVQLVPGDSPGANLSIGTVKYPRTVPRDEASAQELKKRTLTNLYNERPTWLDLAHRKLDEAVFAAYGWSPDISDDELLAKLLDLNLARAAEEASAPASKQ